MEIDCLMLKQLFPLEQLGENMDFLLPYLDISHYLCYKQNYVHYLQASVFLHPIISILVFLKCFQDILSVVHHDMHVSMPLLQIFQDSLFLFYHRLP